MQTIPITSELLKRHQGSGPRYTSYPTADRFHTGFREADYRAALSEQARDPELAWSLYVHVPFCDTVCFYCACNKIATKNYARAESYVGYLGRELALVARATPGRRRLGQIHFGGGTPTFLRPPEWRTLWRDIERYFSIAADAEISVEIDPRRVSAETIDCLFDVGVNRVSIGVQDFDPDVQRAVNRIQSMEQTAQMIEHARRRGCKSVNIDLIYGLPLQTTEGFGRTLDAVTSIAPERIALYHYAHLPSVFVPQRRIKEEELPSSETKMEIFALAMTRLAQAGYVYIGMDHFARPDDELAVAQREGRLHRNFQGYSTRADLDLIAVGVSAIGKVGATYAQNEKGLEAYYAAIDEGHLPIARGYALDADDLIRREVIQLLMCHGAIDKSEFARRHAVAFDSYFAEEAEALRELAQDKLIEISAQRIGVTPAGRLLLRRIAMVFDKHLRQGQTQARYSKVA